MEPTNLGKVTVSATIENQQDFVLARAGVRKNEDVRSVRVDNALVDTGATLLSLPRRIIAPLGLERLRTRRARTAAGLAEFGIYSPVRLCAQGHECTLEVADLSDDCPVLIGQLPLEHMDWVVDPVGQRLIGNPDHGGEQMIEQFSYFPREKV